MCVFVYRVDDKTEPAVDRRPMKFTEVYLAYVTVADFRKNPRSELGTRTATLDRNGLPEAPQQLAVSGQVTASRAGKARLAIST